MNVSASQHKLFSGKELRTHVDVAQLFEVGWGSHSAEACYIYSSLQTERIHATIFILVDSVMSVSVPDPVDALKKHTKSSDLESIFTFRLDQISNIEVIRSTKLEQKFLDPDKNLNRMTIKCTIKHLTKKLGEEVFIEIYGRSFFIKRLFYSWHDHLIRNSACIDKLMTKTNRELSENYVKEVQNGLIIATKEKNVNETEAILDELANECLCDLDIKDCLFRNKDVILRCINLIEALTTDPLGSLFQEKQGKSSKSTADLTKLQEHNKLKVLQKYGINTMEKWSSHFRQCEENKKFNAHSRDKKASVLLSPEELQEVAIRRLVVIRKCLLVLVCLMCGSEVIETRFNIISGPSPLDLASWMAMIVRDMRERVSQTLGLPIVDDHTLIAKDIDQNVILSSRSNTPRNMIATAFSQQFLNSTTSTRHSWKPSSLSLNFSLGSSIASALQTPIRERMNIIETNSVETNEILRVSQSIQDLQRFLFYYVSSLTFHNARISPYSLYVPVMTQESMTSVGLHLGHMYPSGYLPLGDKFVSYPNWELHLEATMIRISTLLDDILASDAMNTQHNKMTHYNDYQQQQQKQLEVEESIERLPSLYGNLSTLEPSLLPSRRPKIPSIDTSRGPILPLLPPDHITIPASPRKSHRSITPTSSYPATPTRNKGGGGMLYSSPPRNSRSDPWRSINGDQEMEEEEEEGEEEEDPWYVEDQRGYHTRDQEDEEVKPRRRVPSRGVKASQKMDLIAFESLVSPLRKTHKMMQGDPNQQPPPKKTFFPSSMDPPLPLLSDNQPYLDDNNNNNNNNVDEEEFWSPLETQEIALFICCTTLKTLVMDSSLVRESLSTHLAIYWSSIISMFSLIIDSFATEFLECQNESMKLQTTTTKNEKENPTTLANSISRESLLSSISSHSVAQEDFPGGFSRESWKLLTLSKTTLIEILMILQNSRVSSLEFDAFIEEIVTSARQKQQQQLLQPVNHRHNRNNNPSQTQILKSKTISSSLPLPMPAKSLEGRFRDIDKEKMSRTNLSYPNHQSSNRNSLPESSWSDSVFGHDDGGLPLSSSLPLPLPKRDDTFHSQDFPLGIAERRDNDAIQASNLRREMARNDDGEHEEDNRNRLTQNHPNRNSNASNSNASNIAFRMTSHHTNLNQRNEGGSHDEDDEPLTPRRRFPLTNDNVHSHRYRDYFEPNQDEELYSDLPSSRMGQRNLFPDEA